MDSTEKELLRTDPKDESRDGKLKEEQLKKSQWPRWRKKKLITSHAKTKTKLNKRDHTYIKRGRLHILLFIVQVRVHKPLDHLIVPLEL